MEGGAKSGAAAPLSNWAALFYKHDNVGINIIYATPVAILLELEQDGPRGQK
jgi:hypothetical protein